VCWETWRSAHQWRHNQVVTTFMAHTRGASDVESNRGKGGKHWYTICLYTPRLGGGALINWVVDPFANHVNTHSSPSPLAPTLKWKKRRERVHKVVRWMYPHWSASNWIRTVRFVLCAAEGIMGFPLFAILRTLLFYFSSYVRVENTIIFHINSWSRLFFKDS
jgi:hypothetical protein